MVHAGEAVPSQQGPHGALTDCGMDGHRWAAGGRGGLLSFYSDSYY